ncbi:uncharacterized protein LOC131329657 [Rhododendron vialii]|uniref:uncharacterized protein LOC131329657 n=1 Tax=Rhododendron vialii TaxID=182163 RepID=UPI00265FB3E6|nr:uncharacterized protein LOC131329657 [Rhododendron vialii]
MQNQPPRLPQGFIRDISMIQCYNCQAMGHYSLDCPKPQWERPRVNGSQPPQQFGQTGFANQNHGGPEHQNNKQFQPQQHNWKGKQPMETQQNARGCVFALQAEQEEQDLTCVQALFDSGPSPSFISTACVSALGLEIEPLKSSMMVASPLGGKLAVNLICKGREIEVADLRLSYDFRGIDMADFDIILGMDWLSSHRVVIDCHQKMVTAYTPDGTCIKFKGNRQTPKSTTRRTRWQYQLFGWLASLKLEKTDQMELGLPHIVYEYADVFPEELPGLPPQ